MASGLLSNILKEKVLLDTIKQWLLQESNPKTDYTEDSVFSCTQGDFISYLLNFIHDEALCFEKFRETPKKVHTPKSIRKMDVQTKPRRRTALFGDGKTKNTFRDSKTDSPKHQIMPLSPISPLYTQSNNDTTPKGKTMCLGDFISPHRKPGRQNCTNLMSVMNGNEPKRSRRINPTNVMQRKSLPSENTFDFKCDKAQALDTVPLSSDSVTDRLRALKMTNNSTITSTQQKEISPKLEYASSQKELQILCILYVHLINNNMVLNVASELYFIVTLLLSKQYEADYFTSTLFTSIHNVVFFAVECLRNIADSATSNGNVALQLLDKSTLRLLANNERINCLDVSLVDKLNNLGENIVTKPSQQLETMQINVCFDSDTDNREHFPSDSSCNAFRKQRDLFYEILNIWESNHSNDDWSFTLNLSEKIRGLLNMHKDPANFRHLSRLIKSQLIASCTRMQDESLPEGHLNFLSNLPNMSAEKLIRLRSRLVAKDSSRGINDPPNFPGVQEFYKEFILHAQVHMFCVHLKDVFVQELLQLDDTSFESESGIFDQETQNRFTLTTRSLQILAKFVGLIECIPYKSTVSVLNDKLIGEEIAARTWMTPTIDLKAKLNSAITRRSLILLLPWMVEYLAMLDASTLRLPYYEALFEMLFELFLSEHQVICRWNAQLVKCALGWLFEQANFPSELFFRFLNKRPGQQNLQCHKDDGLDDIEMVDINVLYVVCPYLKEFKKLLQYNCNRNGTITSKHITPVTSMEVSTAEMNEKKLRLQLEESFLNSKPSSLRKTLDFISERVASSVVKTICNSIVPELRNNASMEFKSLTSKYANADLTDAAVKSEIKLKVAQLLEQQLLQLKTRCEAALEQQVDFKVHPGVKSLLGFEELPETISVCDQIASRMCQDRVKQWILTHINKSVFKDLDMDFDRITKMIQKERKETNKSKFANLPVEGRPDVQHIDSDDDVEEADSKMRQSSGSSAIVCPSKLLMNLQRNCARILSTDAGEVQPIRVFLQEASRCHKHRADLSNASWHFINKQLLDYLLLTIAHRPDTITNDVVQDVVDLWTAHRDDPGAKELFQTTICVRNLMILMNGSQERLETVWKHYAVLLHKLITTRLLALEDFESQCLAVFRQNWDSTTLDYFCRCLQSVVDMYGNKDQFAFLLSFLADYCTDLEF